MSNPAQVRTIPLDELDEVRDLAMTIWTKHHRSTIAPLDMDETVAALFDLDQMEEDMRERGHAHFIARVGRVDVGFASAHLEGSRVVITHLYVMGDFRGFGLGKMLVRAAQDHFAPVRDLVILVHKGDNGSVDFCLRSGFAVAREISSEFGQYAFTDYVMHKYINPSQMLTA
ncbi:acetyltransferase GNAT family protein [Asticcacaulis biprosthecium C19]|uniref:Acetyltransferase GNAT family protein n=1 Tax=Asticcacaulis biprosthecium C19 TaxID=715226 RepID=F4QL71_9CAUL|nr:GNAT family N-acetyltransferase [Asticcacaulis biprosthecium]EGF93446.1 acetyltransferase GNAT family protein [Asticcacaulis biprosthecium C19]